ncbi:MAG: filamentous hemagglutinin N-terminal domain-containing protein [Nostoc sp.]|uniref:beta strand repeat-containing protein n=1 Tax=Nostoc sp. TaxID=1180 RepID=UPI002FF9D9BE
MQNSVSRLCQFSSVLLTCLISTPGLAQIVPDSTLPVNSQVTPSCTNCTIDGGTIRGANLFHSFREFSVPTGGEAFFNNSASIQNIFTRVTGTNFSNINGLIRVNGIANLFLLNPNGIIFGPNAQLNIGGSFVASTTSSFKFLDGSEFSATNPQAPPLLTINVPLGLQRGSIPPDSTIANRGNLTTGKDLTLEANHLDLQGQLIAGRDVTLKAQGTVQIRDSVTTPFIASAGRDLTIQGNQGVDIFTLNHPQSQFQSLGKLSLVSDRTISGDAHFFSGGEFQIRSQSGQPATFVSLYDPIISSIGDVDIAGSYTGASLLIESLGSVQIQGDINITAPDTVSTFMGSDGILSTRSGLIIRSGQTNLIYGGSNQNNPPTYTTSTVPSGITLMGNVLVQPFNNVGGVVSLIAGTGDINVASIDVSNQSGGDGGAIALSTNNGNLNVNGTLYSVSTSDSGNSGNGGAIALSTNNGNLNVNGTLYSASISNGGNSGNGGVIALSTNNGNLTNNGLLYSLSSSNGGNSGNGGAITLSATNGTITNDGYLYSASGSTTGNSGNGGAIALSATNGTLTNNGLLYSFSTSDSGNSGNGGAIALSATNGDLTTNGYLYSASSGNSGNGGAIALSTTKGNLTNNAVLDSSTTSNSGNSGNGGAIALSTTDGNLTNNGYLSSYSISPTGSGNGGAIAFSSTNGNLTNNNLLYSFSYSINGNSGNGGAIAFTSTNGNLTNNNYGYLSSFSLSGTGNSGNGGAIALTSTNGNLLTNSDFSSFSYSTTGNSSNGGAIALTAENGNITGAGNTLNTFSVAPQGTANVGGNVTLDAKNQVSGLQMLTASSSAQAGAVAVNGQGDLAIADTVILTGKQVTVNTPFTGAITIPVTGTGRSGDVSITSAGNLTLTNTQIESNTKGSDPAGNITFTSPGLATFNQSKILSSTSNSGNAGNITITTGQGISFTNGSSLSATTSSTGKAGDITLNSPTVLVAGDAQISAATQGSGQGGTITVNAPTTVNIAKVEGAAPVLSVAATDAGKAGDIIINTPSLNLSDNARIVATASATATNAEGGGSITLNASQMNLAGIVGVFADTQGQAPAGTLRLNPYANDPTLDVFLAPQSQISASTNGSGKGGDLILTAPDTITLTGAGKLTAETSSSGNAGNISVTTRQFNINGGVELSASTSGSGNAGNLTIAADRVNLSQGARVSSNTSSSGAAGDIRFQTDQLTLNGAGTGLFATTTAGSTGKGGNITVAAKTALFQDEAAIAVGSLGSGAGGNINLTTGQLTLNNGVELSASTSGSGNAGNLTIAADRVNLSQGARVSSNTSSSGAAGDIRFQTDQLTLNGAGTGLFATTTAGSTGKGGNITVAAKTALFQDEAAIAVGSLGSGAGGNISVTANQLKLDTRASLTAETASTQGGNITLDLGDLLLLRRNSLISTTAGTAQSGGNGGNITINTPNGFIVGVLSENSDIRANAFTGNGGKIGITSQGIFGLQFQPRNTPNSDITASSQFGVSGTVQINNLGVDPSTGVVQLPVNFADSSQQIATGCNAQGSSFVVTGRGGLPPNPNESVGSDIYDGLRLRTWNDIRDLSEFKRQVQPIAQTPYTPIIEATGFIRTATGEVKLIAQSVSGNAGVGNASVTCAIAKP